VPPSVAVHRPQKSVARHTPGLRPAQGTLHCAGEPGGTQMPAAPVEPLEQVKVESVPCGRGAAPVALPGWPAPPVAYRAAAFVALEGVHTALTRRPSTLKGGARQKPHVLVPAIA
jgi:hypothetical protein